MAKRKDASAVAPAPPPPPAQLGPPTEPAPTERERPRPGPTWWIQRVARVVGSIALIYWLYPVFFPKKSLGTDGPGWEAIEPRFEPIELDVVKRGAILDAFKVHF